MAMGDVAIPEELVAPWSEWSRRYQKGRRLLAESSGALAATVKEALTRFMGADQREALRALLPDLAMEATPE